MGGSASTPASGRSGELTTPDRVILEIRTYHVRSGMRDEFGRRMAAVAPMLERHGIDIVWMGGSEADDEHFVLLRSFDSLEAREAREDAFYDSDEWVHGPREGIVGLIETYHTVVVSSTDAVVAALRESLRGSKA